MGQGRLLVFTSDLDNQWSRFPLNPAFVPFAVETARYLTAAGSSGRRGCCRTCRRVRRGTGSW